MEPALIVIDGECGLCSRASHYGMAKARAGMLRFIAQQDDEALVLLERHGLMATANETMVCFVGDRPFIRSAAVVQVAKRLRGMRRLQALVWLVPKPLRDAAYRLVAKRRHKWPKES